jgi:hypothetical protein
VIIAEIGLDMAGFPTRAIWAPGEVRAGVKQSAGRTKSKATTGHGDPTWRGAGEAALAARADRHLPGNAPGAGQTSRHQEGHRRGRLLHPGHRLAPARRPDRSLPLHDLGAGLLRHAEQPERAKRNHIRRLEALGYKVTLEPAA